MTVTPLPLLTKFLDPPQPTASRDTAVNQKVADLLQLSHTYNVLYLIPMCVRVRVLYPWAV